MKVAPDHYRGYSERFISVILIYYFSTIYVHQIDYYSLVHLNGLNPMMTDSNSLEHLVLDERDALPNED